MLDWLPIRVSSQMVFAEAFAQMLVAGVPLVDACKDRQSLRRILSILGGDTDAMSVSTDAKQSVEPVLK